MPSKSIDPLILNPPYSRPAEHWKYDRESRLFSRVPARRPAEQQGRQHAGQQRAPVIPNEVRNLLFS